VVLVQEDVVAELVGVFVLIQQVVVQPVALLPVVDGVRQDDA
jgi:hypothetical protein